MTPTRPNLVLAMDPQKTRRVLSAQALQRLSALCWVSDPTPVLSFDTNHARDLLARAEILVTGWGCPPIGAELLDQAPGLKLIAHSAGSVKRLITDTDFFKRGIAITTAADANAVPVAEFTLASILFANKQVFRFRDQYRQDRSRHSTDAIAAWPIGNLGKTVGIVGASKIGRLVIAMLASFDLEILVYDPFLSPDDPVLATARRTDLPTLLAQSDVVSLHAPLLNETRGMIGQTELALMPDGATLINTARGAVVDQASLTRELLSGRLNAVIDVTFPEIPKPDSLLYDLPNVFLTPHVAGALGSEQERLGDLIVDEVARYCNGLPLCHAIDGKHFARIA